MKLLAFALLLLGLTFTSATITEIKHGRYVFFNNQTGGALEIFKANTNESALISSSRLVGTKNQIFSVNSINRKHYTLKAIQGDKVLTVPSFSVGDVDLTNNVLNTTLNTNQQWTFEHKGHGLFAIRSRSSGKYITVREDNKNVYQSAWTGAPNQLFRPMKINPKNPTPIKDGSIYAFISNSTKFLSLDVAAIAVNDGAPLSGYSFYGGPNQYFEVQEASEGMFNLVAVHSRKVLAVNIKNQTENSTVIQTTLGTGDEQLWYFDQTEHGLYEISNVLTGYLLTINDTQGGNVTQAACNDKENQRFYAVEIR